MSICMKMRTATFRYAAPAAIVWFGLWVCMPHARGDEQKLFDFETPGLSNDWKAIGRIAVARQKVPEAAPDKPGHPEGHGVSINVERAGGLYSSPHRIPGDWRNVHSIRFWIYRAPAAAAARDDSTMEVQLIETDGRARFWRKETLTHRGWKEIVIPLRNMRWGTGRVPRFDRVGTLGFWFRNPAEVSIDQVRIDRSDAPQPTELSTAQLSAIAFPDTSAESVTTIERPTLRLITNEPALDAGKLVDHLERVGKQVQQVLSRNDTAAIPPTLIVFATPEEYRAFSPRYAATLNGVTDPPQSQGFTLRGIATSYWDQKQGTLRPVFTHEFVHAYLVDAILLQSQGDWLQEGLASYFQIQFHPQDDLRRIVSRGIADPQQRLPLDELCNGRRIPTNRYWQAMTFVDMLLNEPAYQKHFPRLLAAFQKTGSTNLEPVREAVFGRTWRELEEDWKSFCRRKYTVAAAAAK